mmetsp:Transcript_11496/g.35104  ORF Transcript_11496/g.35104 Transcript_11496/m.35104 type:complete len:394 (-) Transcript_11496:1439-2620(-)
MLRVGRRMQQRWVSVAAAQAATRSAVVFSIRDSPGALKTALESLNGVNMTRIESRPSQSPREKRVEFHVELGADSGAPIDEALQRLRRSPSTYALTKVPWFPRRAQDLDTIAADTLQFGEELDADHPGFRDEVYRQRRKLITTKARSYRYGQKLPSVKYTKRETDTWKLVYDRVQDVWSKHACSEFLNAFQLLRADGIIQRDSIPQLDPVSEYLRKRVGWTIRPVTGLLSPRHFLNALAVKVFHSTQYIRHHAKPFYTPEPDICHEMLGHVPMLCDPTLAEFSQCIGLASLGATDDDIERLKQCYWFTIEFGLTRERGAVKGYGAGLMSSADELEYACTSDEPQRLPWNPYKAAMTESPITKVSTATAARKCATAAYLHRFIATALHLEGLSF